MVPLRHSFQAVPELLSPAGTPICFVVYVDRIVPSAVHRRLRPSQGPCFNVSAAGGRLDCKKGPAFPEGQTAYVRVHRGPTLSGSLSLPKQCCPSAPSQRLIPSAPQTQAPVCVWKPGIGRAVDNAVLQNRFLQRNFAHTRLKVLFQQWASAIFTTMYLGVRGDPACAPCKNKEGKVISTGGQG